MHLSTRSNVSTHKDWPHWPSNKTPRTRKSLAAEAESANQRRHLRHPVNWPASVHKDNKFVCETTVIDVSYAGLGLACQLPGSIDGIFTITLPNIDTFSCRLAWKSNDRCGVELLPMDGAISNDQLGELARLLS